MKKYKVVGLPKMQNGGPGDKKDPDNFTNEELTDYGNMQINVGDSDQGYYGDKHRQRTNKIYTSLNQLKKLFTEGQLNAVNGEWDYDNQIDAQGIYDDESENLIKRYQGLENLMKLNFGDRKGDPTRAVDWMNKDGRRYRKSLRALESDIQDLYLRRMEQYGKNTGVTSYGDNVQYDYVKSTDPEDKIYDDVTGKWTGEYRDKAIPRKAVSDDNENEINLTNKGITNQIKRTSLNRSNVNDRKYIAQQIAEKGYVPKQYAIESLDNVVYAKDKDKERQEKLTAEAERLFIEGAKEGYLPSSAVPIAGKIDDLKSFIKDQNKNLRKYRKNKDDFSKQKKKDAKFLNISADLLGTVEGEKLVRERLKTASDEDQRFLVNLYQKYFSDYDPNAVQFTQDEQRQLIETGWGDGSNQAVIDLAKIVAYGAPLAPATISAATTLMSNPLFQLGMDAYFAYETPAMVRAFKENLDSILTETEAGSMDRLSRMPGLVVDGAFAAMGFGSARNLYKQGSNLYKNITGAVRSEAEIAQILRSRLSAKGKIPNKQYKQRMKNREFAKQEEKIQNASLEELQAMSAREGVVMDKAGNTIIQTESPIYINYTKKGKPGVELTDASGKVIKNTGKGDVIIGMGKTERVSVPSVGSVKKVVKPTKTRKIKIGNSQIEIGVYKDPGKALQKFTGPSAAGTAKATEEANFEIAKASEVGLGEQYGNATVMAIESGVKISAKELETLAKEVDVLIANGQAIVLNQKALTKSPKIVDPEGLNKFNITEKDILDAANRIRERLLSPKFVKNNAAATGRTEEEVIESINKMVSEFESGKVTFSNNPASEYGAVYNGKGKIDINVGNLGNRDQALGALDHEINHAFSDMGKTGTVIPPKVVIGPDGKRDVVFGSNLYDTYPTTKVVGGNYINAPQEQQVRARRAIQWLEDNAGLKVGEEITTPMIKKLGEAIKNGETRFAERNTGGKWTAPPSEGGTFEYQYKKGDYMGGVDGGGSMSGEYFDLRDMFSNLDIKSVLTESEISLLDKIPTGSKKWNETVKDLLNKAYQAALPLIGGAGAAMLSDSDEDMDAMGAAAFPLLMFTRGKGSKAYKNIIKGIRELFIAKVPIEGAVKPYPVQNKLSKVINKITQNDLEKYGEIWNGGILKNIDNESLIPSALADQIDLFYDSILLRKDHLAKGDKIGTDASDVADEYERGQDLISRFTTRLENAIKNESKTGLIKEAGARQYLQESALSKYDNLKKPMNDPLLNSVLITKYGNEIEKYIVNNVKDPKIKDEIVSKLKNVIQEHTTNITDLAVAQKKYLETLDERLAIIEEVIQTGKYQGKNSIPRDKVKFLFDTNTRQGYNNIISSTPEGEILLDRLNLTPLADDARLRYRNGVESRIPINSDGNWLENVYMDLLKNKQRYERRASGELTMYMVHPNFLTSDLFEAVYNPELIFENTENKLRSIFNSYIITPLKNKERKLKTFKESNLELQGDQIVKPAARSVLYGDKGPLNAGVKDVTNLKTGNPEKLKVFTSGSQTTYVKNNELIVEDLRNVESSKSENLVSTVTDNRKFIEDLTGGKVSGSARLVEANVSTIPGDYDVIMTESAFNKNLKKNKDVDTSSIDVDKVEAQVIDVNGENVDLVIMKNGPDGLVAPKYKSGKSSVEEELFKQFFPKEFQKATDEKLEKVFETVAKDGAYYSKVMGSGSVDPVPNIPIKIPLTAEQLLAGVDFEVKSIIDAFIAGPTAREGSAKAKHILKSEAILLEADPSKIAKAQDLYVKSTAGFKAEVAPDFINYFKKDVRDNIRILKDMGYEGTIYTDDVLLAIAENPERMQVYLNDWFINNTIVTRQIGIRDMMDFVTKNQEKLGKDLEVTVKNVIEALTEWNVTAGGGSNLGAGSNVVTGPAYTGWNTADTDIGARGIMQYDFVNSIKKETKDFPAGFNPEELIYFIKSKTGQIKGNSDPYEVQQAIIKLNKKYNVEFKANDGSTYTYPSRQVRNISDLMSKVKMRGKEYQEWYEELGRIVKTPFITRIGMSGGGDDRGVGNSIYAGGTNQWEELGQSIAWTFLEDAERLKSMMTRSQALQESTRQEVTIKTMEQFYETKQLFKEGRGKVSKQLQQAEQDLKIINQKFINNVDKLQKDAMNNAVSSAKQSLQEIKKLESEMMSTFQRIMELQQEASAIDAGYQEFKSVVRPWVKIVIATIAGAGIVGAGISTITSSEDNKTIDELNKILIESEDNLSDGPTEVELIPEKISRKRKGWW